MQSQSVSWVFCSPDASPPFVVRAERSSILVSVATARGDNWAPFRCHTMRYFWLQSCRKYKNRTRFRHLNNTCVLCSSIVGQQKHGKSWCLNRNLFFNSLNSLEGINNYMLHWASPFREYSFTFHTELRRLFTWKNTERLGGNETKHLWETNLNATVRFVSNNELNFRSRSKIHLLPTTSPA